MRALRELERTGWAVAALYVTSAIGPALAGEETDLTFYGLGHLSLDSSENTTNDDTELASNSSRIGLKASYQLSDTVTLFGQLEQGVDLTGDGANDGNGPGDTGNIFSRARDSFIGLKTDWGTVRYGRQGFLNQWVYDYNLFADQVGDLGNIWGGTGFAGRGDNAVSYETPDFSGFSAMVVYTPAPADTPDDDITVVKANYRNGGWAFGLGYGVAEQRTTGGFNGVSFSEDYVITALTTSYTFEEGTWAGFDISGSSIGAGYQSETDIRGIDGNDRDSFTFGGALKMNGRHQVKAQVTHSSADGSSADATQFAAGYDYAVNDWLTLYAAYATVSNDTFAAFTSNNYGHGRAAGPEQPGSDPSTLSFGAVFSFECRPGCRK